MGYKFLIPPSTTSKRPKSEGASIPRGVQLNSLINWTFHSTTVLFIGAVIQGLLVLAIPRIWVLLPSMLVLFTRFANTLAITFKFRPNPYLEDAIFQKWSPVIPDTDGNFSDQPGDEKVAVLLLCAKANHPLGLFAPNMKEVGDFAQKMSVELNEQAPDNGFLGQSSFQSVDARGALQVMMLSYWRSLDDILNYSQGPLHKEAWTWWDQMVAKDAEGMRHVGISHEMFEAPRSRWEGVSLNFQPTRLGATTYLRKGDKLMGGTVDDTWVSPIVAAKGRMRTSRQRLNWADNAGSRSDSGDEKY